MLSYRRRARWIRRMQERAERRRERQWLRRPASTLEWRRETGSSRAA